MKSYDLKPLASKDKLKLNAMMNKSTNKKKHF